MENSNEPAYPISEEMTDRIDSGITIYTGLTKREYFSGLAMQGLLASFTEKSANGNWGTENKMVAEVSVMLADELLKQLEK
jgi:hypothetical protein